MAEDTFPLTPVNAVAAPVPTEGQIAKPGAEGQQPDTVPDVLGVSSPDSANSVGTHPAPSGQISANETPAYPQPDQVGPGTFDSSPPGVASNPGNSSTIAGDTDTAVSLSNARHDDLEAGLDSGRIGDPVPLPDVPSDVGKQTGGSMAHGADYAEND